MASTAEELTSQAEQMQELIAFFQLANEGRQSRQMANQFHQRKGYAAGSGKSSKKPAGEAQVKIAHLKNGNGSRSEKTTGVPLALGNDRLDEEFERF
jgi:methyl-accepting chemotaxis protein